MRYCILFFSFFLLSLSTFADSESAKVFKTIKEAQKVSKAKIIRGKTEIPVDLADAGARNQIKDYDVLMLEEGVYATLGNFTAKYVRVRGQGQRKTILSSLPQGSSPIPVNSTELWDMTVADAQFQVSDLNGLWAVNVEFVGSILVRPKTLDKSPAFAIRTTLSDLTHSNIPTMGDLLYSHFLSNHGGQELMPIKADLSKDSLTVEKLLKYEDEFDRQKDMHLKDRIGYKGLFARGMNYLYQKDILEPKFDLEKYGKLAKSARTAKSKGHLYVSMLYWAEADRLSGHAKFDEVLREITPLNQKVGQECGCTVEGQGLASNLKSQVEKNLYAKIPVSGLPGNCKIQTLQVNVPKGGKLDALISQARLDAQMDQVAAFKARETAFQETMLAHSGTKPLSEDDFVVGAEAMSDKKKELSPNAVKVADVDLPGAERSFTTPATASTEEGIVEPIAKLFKDKFSKAIAEAKVKLASTDLSARVDGFITWALYGDDPARQAEYESLHEQQFGRKTSPVSAMSSAFSY